MASKNPDAPICLVCNRSEGIHGESCGTIEWRRGKWRWVSDAGDFPGEVDFCCNYCGNDDQEKFK